MSSTNEVRYTVGVALGMGPQSLFGLYENELCADVAAGAMRRKLSKETAGVTSTNVTVIVVYPRAGWFDRFKGWYDGTGLFV